MTKLVRNPVRAEALGFRVAPELAARIKAIASRDGVAKSDVARRLLALGLELDQQLEARARR